MHLKSIFCRHGVPFIYLFLLTTAHSTLAKSSRTSQQLMASLIQLAALDLLKATERQSVTCRQRKIWSRRLRICTWRCWPIQLHHWQMATVLLSSSWAEDCTPQCPSILLFLPLNFQTASSSQLREGRREKRTQLVSTTCTVWGSTPPWSTSVDY